MKNNVDQKLNSIIDKSIAEIENIVVFKDPNGTYNLFNRYLLKKENQEYVVRSLSNDVRGVFCKLKNAVAWCVYDKKNMFYKAKRVSELDRKLSSLTLDIQVHEKLVKNINDNNEKLIYLAKLNEEKLKKKKVNAELEDHIQLANDWQLKDFYKSKH